MPFEFTVKRQKRKTMALHVLEDARVEVRVPKWLAKREIDKFVKERSRWVVQQREKRLQKMALTPGFTQGELQPYLGASYPLNIQKSSRNAIVFGEKNIIINSKEPDNTELTQSILREGYRAKAKLLFAQRLNYFFELMDLTCSKPDLKVRVMKRRWGSCSSKGIVTLNLELMKYPQSCIDYVVVHELCHLLEMNHSPRFYRHLAKAMPDWRQREQLLEQLSH